MQPLTIKAYLEVFINLATTAQSWKELLVRNEILDGMGYVTDFISSSVLNTFSIYATWIMALFEWLWPYEHIVFISSH